MEKFASLGLSGNVLAALQKKGWETPSPVQEKTIPLLLQDVKDVVAQAQTGTGKTGAFGLPLIDKLDDSSRKVQALVLCPTRELALQVAEEITSFKGDKKLWVQAVYGGASYSTQERALQKGAQIVVGTPGRIRDHIERGTLKLDAVTHVVLDEADEMLNMGFEEEVREILKSVPDQRRMLMFSATMPPQILKLAKTFMGEYEVVAIEKQTVTTDLVDQLYFEVRDSDRFEALCRIIDTEPEFYGIVFCRTKAETDLVSDKLIDRGYDAEGIHGDVTQSQRELILKKFKLRKVTILVATDVAARGIDVNDLTHVVNYNLPQDPEAYVHRIGRTGRAGKHGTAITLIAPSEFKGILFIQKVARTKLTKEEVPSVSDVIATKKMKLKTELSELAEKGKGADYLEIAREILEDVKDPELALSALLAYSMKDTLRESSYRELAAVKAGGQQQRDTARLFVAKGHMDNMNAGKVAQFLAAESGVDSQLLTDIRVFEKFSFVTAPFMEAEQILAVFGKRAGGRKPLVTRAKDKDSSGGGGNYNNEGNRSSKPEFRERKPFGERKTYGEKRNDGEKKPFERKPFSERKPFESKREKATTTNVSSEGRTLVKRSNKNVDYLEKPKREETKPRSKKESDTSEVDKFMSKFDDTDLSW